MAVDDTTEEWRPIEGHPGYEFSSHGRVRSLAWIVTTKRGIRKNKAGRILKPHRDKYYWCVGIGEPINRRIHTLVCAAFHGPKPTPMHEVAHNDGNGFNNVYSNLRWDTKKGNMADTIIHGTRQRGSKHANAKIIEEDVLEIRLISGWRHTDIATLYGVSRRTIGLVISKKAWAHL